MNNLKTTTRLNLAFGLVLLITALIAALGIWRLGTLKEANQHIATVVLERNSLAQRWTADVNLNWVRASAALKTSDAAASGGMPAASICSSTSVYSGSLGGGG